MKINTSAANRYNAREWREARLRPRHLTLLTRDYQARHGLVLDGMAGPEVRRHLETSVISLPADPLRGEWVRVCLEELGKGELGGNNQGDDVDRYRFGREHGAWCAWYLCWCLHEACGRLGMDVPIKLTGGARRLWKRVGRAGTFTDYPVVGSVWCEKRGPVWRGHVGLVVAVDRAGGTFTTVEGNKGRYPSKVRLYTHEMGEPKLLGFSTPGAAPAPAAG